MIRFDQINWGYLLERYRSITNIGGTVIVAWLLSAMVSQIIALLLPNPQIAIAPANSVSSITEGAYDYEKQVSLDDYMPICTRNIFDLQKRTVCMEEVAPGEVEPTLDLDSAPIKSDLPVKLLGTLVSSNPVRSFATIQPNSGGESGNYYIDQMIQGEGKITDIVRNKVFFIRNGHREYLEVENIPNIWAGGRPDYTPPPVRAPIGGGIRLEGNKAIITRSRVDATLGDLNNIITQARMIPNISAGQVDGFKVLNIQPGSIFSELGLKDGDVINRINGTDVNSIEKALPMLQLLRTESSIAIDITRGGVKRPLNIEVR